MVILFWDIGAEGRSAALRWTEGDATAKSKVYDKFTFTIFTGVEPESNYLMKMGKRCRDER